MLSLLENLQPSTYSSTKRKYYVKANHFMKLGKASMKKKRFLSGIAQMRGGGLPIPEFFGPFSRSTFLVNKKSLFLQKCQCIELLTVF